MSVAETSTIIEVSIPNSMAASTGRRELLQARLDRFRRALRGVERGNIRAVHRTRVASRRLRELLPVLQLDSASTDKLARRLRKITRALGPVRELDVLLLLVDELQKSGRHDAEALAAVRDHIQRDRERSKATNEVAVELRRVADRLDRTARELDHADRGSDGRAWRWALDARVARRALMLTRAIDEAGALYLPGRLHSVRIALKKFRYAVELSAEAGRPMDAANLRLLERWQDLLGRLHDVQVLLDRVRQAQASQTPVSPAAEEGLNRLLGTLEATCRQIHARYIRQRGAMTALSERLGVRSSLSSTRPAARRAS